MHRRLIAVGVVATVAMLTAAVPAHADGSGFGQTDGGGGGSGFGYTDGNNVGAGAVDTSAGPGSSGGGGSSAQRCDYRALNADESHTSDLMAQAGWGDPKGNGPGAWYRKICYGANGLSSAIVIWIPARVDPLQLARQALDQVPVPQPGVNMNPPAGRGQVVNVQSWLWINQDQWQPVTASASAGGITVTTTATPDHIEWNMGNGDTIVCAGPGTPYDPNRSAASQSTSCSYTYRHSSAGQPGDHYVLAATVVYRVEWTATGVAAGGVLGPITQTSTMNVRVAEIQALNQ